MRHGTRDFEQDRRSAPGLADDAVRQGRDDDQGRGSGWRSAAICFAIGAVAVIDLASACLELLFL
ncbi:hypothetical protein [Methylobacterium platani]|uniref:Uncharacterized protein n=2 Tax=Methylobacterium platani TaxID=427683 RepID=A0A179SAI7_9HYPH|nr:hypothetical protein [Methylobacterium platani]KMO11883.1 hypothetical protein SQ03_25895 [Methylobacterium platani JCM 14648]OAS24376.1 hypothetical protein A5481_14355 [Methylobacterium platani]